MEFFVLKIVGCLMEKNDSRCSSVRFTVDQSYVRCAFEDRKHQTELEPERECIFYEYDKIQYNLVKVTVSFRSPDTSRQ